MAHRVAVEDGLTPVKEALAREGFDVVSLRGPLPPGVVAVVVSGMDDDLLGRADRETRAPVIDASGRTPEAVAEAVRARVGPRA